MSVKPAAFDLHRVATMSTVATLAVAQPLFGLILENRDEFPFGGLFHLWVVAWALLLPLAALLAVDTLLERTRPRWRPAWTAALCSGTAVSLIRQAFVYYGRQLDLWGLGNLFLAAAIPAAALAFALAVRHPAPTRRYLAALGLLAALLAGRYALGTGLWGPAWRPDGTGPAEAPATPSPTPVFLVVFDELGMDVLLKDGRLDAERFPRLSAFATENAWFSRAASNHHATARSVPCMLTGRRFPGPDAPTLLHFLQGRYAPVFVGGWPPLHRWMRQGARDAVKFETRGTLEETGRNPLEVARILAACARDGAMSRKGRAVEDEDSGLLIGVSGAHAFGQVDLIAEAVARRPGPGLFLYWHSPLPHAPFIYTREGKLHGRPNNSFTEDADPAEVLENYRDQVGLVDALFGRFVDTLRKAGLYDSAIIVVTGDHGMRTGGPKLQPPGYPEVMSDLTPHVPLFLKAPGMRAGRHDDDYQHIDLAPTLLDLLEVPFDPAAFEGVSLRAAERPARLRIHTKDGVDYVQDAATGLWRARAK